ncbi:glycosyltransferase family 4 protein [Burkholderia cepacia]|uniref:glycosyltransferase family 4 protein n=1 Tax=Burkholderia cepacia TaxID=292 RepID=UPI00075D8488|nr:glycosyltransferase family 1 protein [Burkholderia cepacia]KWC92800.1 hypothetical protein WL56_03490 [Burkholderia cepacia]MBJ9753723.1 glycosyltransferase family 4 protein [Burkholderia cepacia]
MSPIFLDVSRLLTRAYENLHPTGVDRVGLAYIQQYGDRARAIVSRGGASVIFTEKCSQSIFSLLVSTQRDRNLIRKRLLSGIATAFLQSEYVRGGFLLHTSHNGMEFQRYYNSMRRRGIRSVFMIHDLIPLTHAEYCRPGVDATHRRRIHTALNHADGLIGNSQATLDDLAREAQKAGLPVPPSVVARLASGVTITARSSAPLDEPYFLLLGTIEPRKNHWFMLHIWRRIVETFGTAPKLVIVGRRGWECENVVDMLDRCDSLRPHVIERSDCSDAELHGWIQHARALLFPSFVEGYGMPLVEAFAAGTPVLASDLGVFKEIAGDTPDYLDPLDGPAWIARVVDYAQTASPARDAQLSRIRRFKEPTWAEHFACVDSLLESLSCS